MHSPLRSEAEVFRLAVIIGLGAALAVAAGLLFGPTAGIICAAALVGFGLGIAWRSARGSLPRRISVAPVPDARHRILVVANETVGGRRLLDEIRTRAGGHECEVFLVTPALVGSRAEHWASDVDGAIELARGRMEASLAAIRGLGLQARGEIGDSDPNVAIEDALRLFPADEIVISTHPPQRSRWLEHDVVRRAREEIDLPVTHVVVDLGAERQGHLAA
jgi:hypothetical protein